MKIPSNDRGSASKPLKEVLSVHNPTLYAMALVLAIVPIWLTKYLPMVDLPGHAALMTALERLAAGDGQFVAEFEANWLTPYLLGYGLLYGLSTVFPVTIAAKILVSISVLLTALLSGMVLREVGADVRWKWLVIPGSYSLAFYWGFVSFVVAIPVGLWLLIQAVKFDRNPTLRRGMIVAALTIAVLFSHVIVMGLVCLCALAFIAGSRHGDMRGLVLRWLPFTAPIPLVAVWFVFTSRTVEGVQDAPFVYGSVLDRLSYLISQPSGFDYVTPFGLVVALSILLLPIVCGSRFARHPARWLPFVAGMTAFFLMPSFAFRAAFLYERLGIFLALLWLLAWDAPAEPRRPWLSSAAMVVVLLWAATNTWRFAAFASETRHFDAILQHMEPDRRVASLVVSNTPSMFAVPAYLHFGSWYQAIKGGIVDFNFADFQMVVQRSDISAPRVVEGLAWRPDLFDWTFHGGSRYDYFLIKADGNVAPFIFREKLASVTLIAQSGGWWLYQNLDRLDRASD